MKRILLAISAFLSSLFNLHEDKAEETQIIESIRGDVVFKGTNLWTLIFAIFIASIGLNVNSTAVVIGAMLISPLMGPIMGIGLAVGINDFDLLKRGGKNLLLAAAISIATSALYFTISPLHDASSELLARTNPSIWDVFIAFFGGMAGIVAGTRKKKSNVIPGVAIATALMPPLCTAGFGLATGKWFYFLGALYLFFINSLFICLATLLIVKHLNFRKHELSSLERERRISRYIFLTVSITLLPSIYLGYRIVQRSIFESNAKRFVQHEFHFPKTQVVTRNFLFDGKQRTIELLLVGQVLDSSLIDAARGKLPAYQLDDTRLVVHQGLDANQKIDLSAIKASVLEEVFATEQQTDSTISPDRQGFPALGPELKALYPTLHTYSLSYATFHHLDTARMDSIVLFVGDFNKPLPRRERTALGNWLKQRIPADSVRVILP